MKRLIPVCCLLLTFFDQALAQGQDDQWFLYAMDKDSAFVIRGGTKEGFNMSCDDRERRCMLKGKVYLVNLSDSLLQMNHCITCTDMIWTRGSRTKEPLQPGDSAVIHFDSYFMVQPHGLGGFDQLRVDSLSCEQRKLLFQVTSWEFYPRGDVIRFDGAYQKPADGTHFKGMKRITLRYKFRRRFLKEILACPEND